MKLKSILFVGMLFVAMVAQAQSWQEVRMYGLHHKYARSISFKVGVDFEEITNN